MRLDRTNGRQKYAIVKLRAVDSLSDYDKAKAATALRHLEELGALDYGGTPESEFFVMRLRDKYAERALLCYGYAAHEDGEAEYARDVLELAGRAGSRNPFCKKPD